MSAETHRYDILLVGNPNVGKSVIFACLTGRYTIVSNYPGTTVELSSGPAGFDRKRNVIDTPGVNSLFPKSEDEKVTRDYLLRYRDATVVQVADAKNLYRALLLTTQLAELGCRIVLVLNMTDEARQRGIVIDTRELSSMLGTEVVETVAVEKEGIPRLIHALRGDSARSPAIETAYPAPLRKAINELSNECVRMHDYDFFGKLTVLSGDRDFLEEYGKGSPEEASELSSKVRILEERLPNPFSYYIAAGHQKATEGLLRSVVARKKDKPSDRKTIRGALAPGIILAAVTALLYLLAGKSGLQAIGLHPTLLVMLGALLAVTAIGTERMDRVTLHPLIGLIPLALVLYLVYQLVGVFAAQGLVGVLEERFFGQLVVPAISRLFSEGWIKDLIVGEYGLVSVGLTYSVSIVLPIVTVFFLVFGVLEDTGYFPRLTVLTNNAFRLVGVNGKATLPIALGFGCVTMSVLASRILETKKERIIVITLLSLAIPCSAQLGIIMALSSAISIQAVLLIAAIIFAEFLLFGRLLSKLLKGRVSDFVLELPPLRAPKLSNIWLKTWARVRWFLREALPFFLLATFILFLLDKSGGLQLVYRLSEPVVKRFLGLPVETAGIFIVGFFRRDYGAAGLFKLWADGVLVGNDIVVALVVMSLFMPCLATLIVTIKELGIKYAFAIFIFVLAVSILSGGLLNIVLSGLGVQLAG